MKNIHVLPTDKPSRLWTNNLKRRLELDEFPSQHPTNIAKNIYITSNEEIKEGDWYFFNIGYASGLKKADEYDVNQIHLEFEPKKIILTTHQDLVKDGVIAINDEFLEWFVKNPSCEFVEIVKDLRQIDQNNPVTKGSTALVEYYKIIIPKEEPKQENCCTPIGQIKRYVDCVGCDRKPKQETLEEAANRILSKEGIKLHPSGLETYLKGNVINAMVEMAKWQKERMYSEEEVRELLIQKCKHFGTSISPFNKLLLKQDLEWFEKFKKK